jgi:hypothetical protein
MMKTMLTLPNIPVNPKTGLPENWDNWTQIWKDGYLEKTLYQPFAKRTGVDLKAAILKALDKWLFELRVRAGVAKKFNDPIFQWDLEYRIDQALKRLKARGYKSPTTRSTPGTSAAPVPRIRVAPQAGVKESTRLAAERVLNQSAAMRRTK